MPVSTRSQIFNGDQEDKSSTQRARPRTHQEDTLMGPSPLRNPHHGLKEKMKSLTLMYEQHKLASAVLRNTAAAAATTTTTKGEAPRFTTHPSIDLLDTCRKEAADGNRAPALAAKENTGLPPRVEDVKENYLVGNEKIVGFSCPVRKGKVEARRNVGVARRLSMGGLAMQSELKCGGGDEDAQDQMEQANQDSNKVNNSSRILVFVRLRPMAKKEKEAGSRCCIRIVNRKDIYLTEFASSGNDYLRLKRLRGRHFTFDAAFPDSTTQQEVYSKTTAELVEGVLQGRNGSVFCYGATGAGKTYTMLGTVENPGVMVLAIKDLFTMMRQRSYDGNHAVHLSYLEVYNETVRDLLSPGRPLVLREDKQGIVAAGLTQYRAYSTDEVMSLLQQGNQNRTTEPTRVNETSSRSHAILQVVAEYQVRDSAMSLVNRVGKLSLIDLAGSERALATDQRTLRSIEGANINRSLLALSSCINALVEGKKHIPYRNSKLTQLLKDSLGGTCNTVMIANISPSNLSFGETQNTLHWADRAKQIRTKACEVNEERFQVPVLDLDQSKLLLELQKENRELRVQIARQQQKLLTLQADSLAAHSSPAPSSATSMLSPSPSQVNEKGRTRASIFSGNCINTPKSKKRGAEEMVRVLQRNVKALEAEMERMKKEHMLQLKQKDEFIREHSRKCSMAPSVAAVVAGESGGRRVVTRSSLRSKESSTARNELKSPGHRFQSPAPTAKKRSFWDIATANTSPSTKTLIGSRKTRSHATAAKMVPAPSMLLQGMTRKNYAAQNHLQAERIAVAKAARGDVVAASTTAGDAGRPSRSP
ncbi:hypothetical protein Scep_016433 [Stephania cephalantha]|uniref:Kinesin-like protein n=1 Tax=Stephania cephalantha TaxID=152367 RepID=A0AAP0IN73_9MAGN